MAAISARPDQPQTPSLEVRLTGPASSDTSHAGAVVKAAVTSRLEVDGRVLIPEHSIVWGIVRRAVRVRLGLIHERAALQLEFREYELPDGRRFPLEAHVQTVDNARESVTRKGVIKGIVAASTAPRFVRGVWYMPRPTLLERSLAGLTGASGRIWTEYAFGPVGAATLFAVRCFMFPFPDPAIYLPAGTDLRLAVSLTAPDAPTFDAPPDPVVAEPLADWLRHVGKSIAKANGRPTPDVINFAFVGTEAELQQAFQAAGWRAADPFSRISVSQSYKAFCRMSGYPTAPVSKLLYEGAEPDFVFQKALNSVSKRHHVRIWKRQFDGRDIWLGAATHDVGIKFDADAGSFTHRIDPGIDIERAKLASDLAFAGCSAAPAYVSIDGGSHSGEKGIVTDGRVAVLTLRPCESTTPPPDTVPVPRSGRPATRLARRAVLETRNYVLRENVYHWAYVAVQWCRSEKRRSEPVN